MVHMPPPNPDGSVSRQSIEAHLPPSKANGDSGHLVLGAQRVIGLTQWEGEDGWHVWAVDESNVWLSDEFDTIESAGWYAVNVLTTWATGETAE
jgi:hypothetical protein